jgi:hypothetical protein
VICLLCGVGHSVRSCTDDVNLLGKNICIMKKNTEGLSIRACKKVGQEVNAEKTKCIFMSCHRTTGQNCCVNISNKSLEYVANFRYLGCLLLCNSESFVFLFAM